MRNPAVSNSWPSVMRVTAGTHTFSRGASGEVPLVVEDVLGLRSLWSSAASAPSAASRGAPNAQTLSRGA